MRTPDHPTLALVPRETREVPLCWEVGRSRMEQGPGKIRGLEWCEMGV